MGAAVQRRPRHALKLWHRWFGLVAGLWLALLAATGIAVTFYDELDSALNSDWRTVPASMRAAPIGNAIIAAERALPGFAPNMIEVPGHPGDSLWMMGRAPVNGNPRPIQIFADPRDGSILGWRESGAIKFDRRHAMDVVYGLHIDLLAGPWMTWFFGLVSLLWVIDHGIAAALSFPKGMRWFRALRVEGRRGSLKRLFDTHRACGLWFLPVTLVLAVTGVTLAWPDDSREAVGLISPITGRLHESMGDVPELLPGSVSMRRSRASSAKRASGFTAFASSPTMASMPCAPTMRATATIRGDCGIMWRCTMAASTGSATTMARLRATSFFAWQYPLHSGKAFGLGGRLLVLLGGVVTLWLCFSGVTLWWRRRRRFF